MTIVVFTPTLRYGGIDVNRASLLAQKRVDLVWVIGDDLYEERVIGDIPGLKYLHFDTAQNKRANNEPSSLAGAYRRAIEIAREYYDADLFVSMQDYMWIPNNGIERFVRMAEDHPTDLLTGLCSLSKDPYPYKVVEPRGPITVFAEPYDGHKPKTIGWRDCRLEKWRPNAIVNVQHPIWWETNWAAIPRTILHDQRLNFDIAYNRGYAYENQDYALKARRLGYGIWMDTGNHAISLPHTKYFPDEQKRLASISNRDWHEARHAARAG